MLELDTPARAGRIRRGFAEAGYSEEGLVDAFANSAPASPQLRNRPRLLDQTRTPTALNALARWFLIGEAQEEAAVRSLVPDTFVEDAVAAGLLARAGTLLVPRTLIGAVGELLIAFDRFEEAETNPEYVLAVSPSARHLRRAMIPGRWTTVLDLGTGCGVLALFAAGSAGDVTATDLNPRAVGFTRFNARLNGIETITALAGDRFEPVANRRFGYIVSNPPFIIAPPRDVQALSNPFELDEFCRGIVRKAPEYLEDGGYLQMTCEWVAIEGEPWHERLASWFEGTGCDAWVLCNFDHDPSTYAQTRLREGPEAGPEVDAGQLRHWMEYYRSRRVVRIHGGLITLRRRAGRNWLRIENIIPNLQEPFGAAIRAGFEMRDYLDAHDGDALLGAVFHLAPDAVVTEEKAWANGEWRPRGMSLRLATGLRPEMSTDGEALLFASLFDGVRTGHDVARELASRLGRTVDEVRPAVVDAARRLAEQGFLLPGPAPRPE